MRLPLIGHRFTHPHITLYTFGGAAVGALNFTQFSTVFLTHAGTIGPCWGTCDRVRRCGDAGAAPRGTHNARGSTALRRALD